MLHFNFGLLTALFTGDFMSLSFSDKFWQFSSSCLIFRGSDTRSAGISLFGSCSLFVALLLADLTIPAPFGSMRLRGVFTWENWHRRDFHTGMTFWFRIAFTWWRGYFISRLFERTVHLDKIHVRFKIANITHTLPVLVHLQLTPADRFNTETGGRFAFTWYRCEISYRSVILAPIQKPGWLAPV